LSKYEAVIGLEIHVQLNTNSKAFCGDDASFGALPNTHISTISLAHPGTLPKPNIAQIEKSIQLGLALGCTISTHNSFDRKNYFYADSPKAYQITQDRNPICIGGSIPISNKTIRLHHIHMEEDAGKSIHDIDPKYSLIDLNRAGVPLVEIVTEPDLRSAEEVDEVMTYMRKLVRWIDISDGNMEEGSMRCDCNVSIRLAGTEVLNNRCEIKNVNSMRFARKAIEYEIQRQIAIVESGATVKQQTLNFDPETGITTPLRSKEDAHDYRYFPEPDIAPLYISEKMIQELQFEMPALPNFYLDKFVNEYGISASDALILTESRDTANYFVNLVKNQSNAKQLSNLVIQKIIPYCKEEKINTADFTIKNVAIYALLALIESNQISNSVAFQQLFPMMIATGKNPMELAEQENLIQNSNTDFLSTIIQAVLAQFPDKVLEYQKGKKGLIGLFVGEVMKRSKGKADPKLTNKMVVEALELK
jgi:aspartyl-tRNA(Asn)/glutamyl-tRNA(Gln) amidotransferase subunit B